MFDKHNIKRHGISFLSGAACTVAIAGGIAQADSGGRPAESTSNQVTPTPPEPCAGDLDGDGWVGFTDLLLVYSDYTQTNDIERSFEDLIHVLISWDQPCDEKSE